MTHTADQTPLALRPEDVDVDDGEALADFLDRWHERMWGPEVGPRHPVLPRGWRERRWCRDCARKPGICADGLCAGCVDARVLDGLRHVGQTDRRLVALPQPPRRPIDRPQLAALYGYRDQRQDEDEESTGRVIVAALAFVLAEIAAFWLILIAPHVLPALLHALGGR